MSSLRSVSKALPRISMARIPMVVFANNSPATTFTTPNTAHQSGFSSMPANQKDSSSSSSSSWSKPANDAADKLEHSAKQMSAKQKKDYLHEVKRYEAPEDELLMELGLARSSSSPQKTSTSVQGETGTGSTGGTGFSKAFLNHGVGGSNNTQQGWIYTGKDSGFEDSLVDQVQADVIHPAAKKQQKHKHAPEIMSSICQELKKDAPNGSKLSSYASDAIHMVESRNILKHDKAPVHDLGDEDPSESLGANFKTK
ncbi:hypothetical protein BG004_008190 [Podila humilis]|nr:hypothetical protein BG004_008190 [Podila humilis]